MFNVRALAFTSSNWRPLQEDDPIIEYEDEFGRMRTARRSEVPRNLRPDAQSREGEDVEYVFLASTS